MGREVLRIIRTIKAFFCELSCGTNASRQAVQWPAFPGSSTQGFAGKYTPRQLDSIVAQILSIGSKAVSSDFPSVSGNVEEQIGHRFMVAPYVFPGWLSRQWVIGLGRSPKVTQMYMESGRFPRILRRNLGPCKSFSVYPPFATMDIWLEWWLPAPTLAGKRCFLYKVPAFLSDIAGPSQLLNVLIFPVAQGRTCPTRLQHHFLAFQTPTARRFTVFGPRLLHSNQGIDFAGNPGVVGTRTRRIPGTKVSRSVCSNRQQLAGHWKLQRRTRKPMSGTIMQPFFSHRTKKNPTPSQEWQPGEMRSIRSRLGWSYRMYMQTNANGFTNVISGGIAVKTQLRDKIVMMEPDPVPLEAFACLHYGRNLHIRTFHDR